MSAHGLEASGFRNLKAVHWNLNPATLYEEAIRRGEGHLAKDGPLVVLTGQHTGRSAGDKFVVKDAQTEPNVWWDNNKAMTPAHFDALYADSRKQPRVIGIPLHPMISGQPLRIKYLEKAIAHMKEHQGVWFTTGTEIVDAYQKVA